jgi:hypothetical protein
MTKAIYAQGSMRPGQTWVSDVALFAAMGQFINYATSLHALRYRDIPDGYKAASVIAGSIGESYATILVRNIREYGNWLLSFAMFAIDHRVGVWCVIVLGSAHWMFALRRIAITSRRLGGL